MNSRRTPPGIIPGMPSCQPWITPLREKLLGVLRVVLESNWVPLDASQPVYWTVTLEPAATGVPDPTVTSWTRSPSDLMSTFDPVIGGIVTLSPWVFVAGCVFA